MNETASTVSTSLDRTANGYEAVWRDEASGDTILRLIGSDLTRSKDSLSMTIVVHSGIAHPRAFGAQHDQVAGERTNMLKGAEREYLASRIAAGFKRLDDHSSNGTASHDWGYYVDEFFFDILKSESEPAGEFIRMSDYVIAEEDANPFLIDGLLVRGQRNILFGSGGRGKSLMALRLAAALEYPAGAPDLYDYGRKQVFGHNINDQGITLYLDYEDTIASMSKRSSMLTNGLGLPPLNMEYRGLADGGNYARHHASVLEFLKDRPDVKLVVIDSTMIATQGFGGPTSSQAEATIDFHALLKELDRTVLLIDHVSGEDAKADVRGERSAKPFGSVTKGNSARNVWSLSKVVGDKGDLPGPEEYKMRHEKCNAGPLEEEIVFTQDWEYESVRFTHVNRDHLQTVGAGYEE